MKKHFLTGLVLLLPVALTCIIVVFLVNVLTRPFQGAVGGILNHYGVVAPHLVAIASRVLILLVFASVILFIGVIGSVFLGRWLLKFGDYIMHRIPIVNKIYKAAQDTVNTLLKSEGTSFSQVVLAPFPHNNSYVIGFISNDSLTIESDQEDQHMISVLIPGTPVPTVGYLLLFKKEELIYIDMKIEDAIKFIVSCGVMFTGFNEIKP